MASPHRVLRPLRLAAAVVSAAVGVYLLVLAWNAPLDGGSAMSMPLAFMGAVLCFSLSVVLVVRQTSVPRRGRPAAR